MIASDTAAPMPVSVLPPRWVMWLAVVLLISLIALVSFQPDLRALAASTWREMRSISPFSLALIFTFKVMQALLSALVWRNLLSAAWPGTPISYRFVLGVDQGQDAVNTILPARGGTWAMLGIFKLAIPRARPSKMLTVWGVQNLAYLLFAGITYVIVAVGLPGRTGGTGRVTGFVSSQPWLAGAIGVTLLGAIAVVAIVGRRKLGEVRQQVREGVAILRTPRRYIRLVFLPSLAAYGFRCAAYATLLSAFSIPVTIWTLALALGSNALAGTVRITPAGLGTTQAIDVVALRDYAAPEQVTAYSLSEIAITAIASFTVSAVALLSVIGLRRLRAMPGHIRRGEFTAALHGLGNQPRVIRARVTARRSRKKTDPV
jgi:hypothetical protein